MIFFMTTRSFLGAQPQKNFYYHKFCLLIGCLLRGFAVGIIIAA